MLVYQPLFLTSASGVSVKQQVELGGLLEQASRRRFPIRVAIIAGRSDLGAVTELWGRPRAYARFLSLELSLAYSGRLLVVMPGGLGFAWPGHSSASAYRTLSKVSSGDPATTAEQAVRSLAAASGVSLSTPAAPAGEGSPATTSSSSHTTDVIATIVAVAAAAAGRGRDHRPPPRRPALGLVEAGTGGHARPPDGSLPFAAAGASPSQPWARSER